MTASIFGSLNTVYGGITANTDGLVSTSTALPPLQIRRWIRNGKHPNALLQNMIDQHVNQAVMYRPKCVFLSPYTSVPLNSSGTTRTRWRFAWHSGPYTRAIKVRVVVAPPNNGVANADSYVQCDVVDSLGAFATVTETFHGGPVSNDIGFDSHVTIDKIMTIRPDLDYQGVFTEIAGGRIQSATVWELPSMTEFAGGYLVENLSPTGVIAFEYRQLVAQILRALWRRGKAHLMSFAVNQPPMSISVATPTNVIDGTTTPNSTTVGQYLNLVGHARRTEAIANGGGGVPIKLAVHCDASGGGVANVVLKRSSNGATAASITISPATGAGWKYAGGFLPDVLDKYDVYASTASGTFVLSSVCVWEHGA